MPATAHHPSLSWLLGGRTPLERYNGRIGANVRKLFPCAFGTVLLQSALLLLKHTLPPAPEPPLMVWITKLTHCSYRSPVLTPYGSAALFLSWSYGF
jgi:hypothetical protein